MPFLNFHCIRSWVSKACIKVVILSILLKATIWEQSPAPPPAIYAKDTRATETVRCKFPIKHVSGEVHGLTEIDLPEGWRGKLQPLQRFARLFSQCGKCCCCSGQLVLCSCVALEPPLRKSSSLAQMRETKKLQPRWSRFLFLCPHSKDSSSVVSRGKMHNCKRPGVECGISICWLPV